MTTTYAIAKRSHFDDSALYVTSVKRDYSIDCDRIYDDRLPHLLHLSVHMKTWATQAAAYKVLANLVAIGGYDDFAVVAIERAA
jgi:hypothetical protein